MTDCEHLKETIRLIAEYSPIARLTRRGREKLIELGLTPEEADAIVERYLCGGFEFERKETK